MQYTPALQTSLNIPKFTNTVTIYHLKEISFVLRRGIHAIKYYTKQASQRVAVLCLSGLKCYKQFIVE